MTVSRLKTFLFALGLVPSIATMAQSELRQQEAAHEASPQHYQKLLENEQVLVLKMVLKPGETDNWHYHNNETVYFEQGGTLRIATPNSPDIQVEVPNGHVMWHQAWQHQVSNLGNNDVVAIIVEAKH